MSVCIFVLVARHSNCNCHAPHYERRYESNASYFLLRNCNYKYNEISVYHGHVL